jgi:hypothetical protein
VGTLGSIIVLLAILLVTATLIAGRSRKRRTEQPEDHFAPGRDRAVELDSRHEHLRLHALSEDTRLDYLEHWREAQALFADDPAQAIDEADVLIRRVMRDRGYGDSDFAQRIGDVSVDYPDAVERYRAAHDVAIRARVGGASTDELRESLTNYRALFDELVTNSAPTEVR